MKERLILLIIALFFGCGEDETPNQPTKPSWWDHRESVTTLVSIDITATSATAQGKATNDGVLKIFGQKFYVTGNFGNISGKYVNADTIYASGLFTTKLKGLVPNSTYKVQAFASTDFSSSSGDVMSFTTLP
jgi:hypothetical protein